MKKYFIFATSFIGLFILLEITFGLISTAFYTPDITAAWQESTSESTQIKAVASTFTLPLLSAFIAASIAYFIPRKEMIKK